jgi:NAD(P)-dependent dehydrogenase (short-subunit alcohol dehydrogenase family)
MTTPLNILITGSNSGFGRLTSETLARAGHRVFAAMRDMSTRNAKAAEELRGLQFEGGGSIVPVEIDVCSDASVEHGITAVLEQSGGRIDVAINNAGTSTIGLEESFTSAQVEAMFNLNVFGPQRINRGVLPGMRERGAGLLIHITSAIGRIVFPGMGLYCASKFALEALAEAYHYELAPLGVDVVIVQPGAYPTPFTSRAMGPGDRSRAPGYGPLAGFREQLLGAIEGINSGPGAGNPQEVADAIQRLIETPVGQRPLRTVVDAHPEGVQAINATCEQVQAAMLGAMQMGFMLKVTPRDQAS